MATKTNVDGMEYIMTDEKDEVLQLIITFDTPTSSRFTLESSGSADPYQLLMLASFFEFEGKYALNRIRAAQEAEWMKQIEEQEKVAVAKPQILKPQ
jgi:hypothetical protein